MCAIITQNQQILKDKLTIIKYSIKNMLSSIILLGDNMFYKYMVVTVDNKDILYLYLNNTEEFSRDLTEQGNWENDLNFYHKISNYLKNNDIHFNGSRISIVINDIVLATIDISDYDSDHNRFVERLEENNDSLKFVDLNHSNGIIETLKLEDYIFGVVSAEMPAIFHEEALKAQAVIARTYALKRLKNNLKIKDYNATQVFRNQQYLKELWQDKYEEYRDKIRKAITDTRNEVIMFDGDYIDAYYHLASNGKTEDSKNVLKLAYPYLVSVDSNWDNGDYVSRRIVPNSYLSKLLKTKITKKSEVQILVRTIGHRVQYIKFNDKVYDGLILARRLGLNSNDFSVSIEKDYTTFTTRGHGHGLGLSKYGAEGMAKSGYTYRQIIEHYYPNTYIHKETNY